ncbi:MAG TPA: uroporphyrinogen decarboxylase [Cyclobacteriaceae bacterium]
MSSHLLLNTLSGKATNRTPVWLMRQAGRVLPEYRKVRESAGSFRKMVTTPELACEVTLQPVDILGVDAAIIFSDILVVPEAMGLAYEMEENRGPVFPRRIESADDLRVLHVAKAEELGYVTDAIALTKRELNGRVPLIGFAGAPWTIFAYMVEGHGSKTFSRARSMLYREPQLAHRLLDMITESTINYLNGQVRAGADAIQIFDSWAGVLGPEQYQAFSLSYIRRICDEVTGVPQIVFPKGAFFARRELNDVKCEAIGIDWNMDIHESRILMPDKVLQGNLDPCALYASRDDIRKETIKMLDAFGPEKHIANLGHGLYPDTDVDSVKFFVDTVKEYGEKVRRAF